MKKVLFFSYSSSSITLTDSVLLKQRRIEIDEQGKRQAKERRQEEEARLERSLKTQLIAQGHRIHLDNVQFSTLRSLSSSSRERKAEK